MADGESRNCTWAPGRPGETSGAGPGQPFATPLGMVPVERPSRDVPHVVHSARVHEQEHSLEVHVPFLQRALGNVQRLEVTQVAQFQRQR